MKLLLIAVTVVSLIVAHHKDDVDEQQEGQTQTQTLSPKFS